MFEDSPSLTSGARQTPVQQGPRQAAPRTDSRTLLQGASELVIEHHGREYRLRLTQQGKLILTA